MMGATDIRTPDYDYTGAVRPNGCVLFFFEHYTDKYYLK